MSQTIYVDRKTIKLSSEKKQLIFHTEEGQRSSLPFHLIKRIIIQGHCLIDTYLLGKLAEHNITTVLFSNYRSKQMAIINGLQHNDAKIHIKQYQFYQDESLTLSAAKKLVKAKVLRQYRRIKQYKTHYPQYRRICFKAEKNILLQIQTIDTAKDDSQLLGIEGFIASQYFSVLTHLFPEKLNFTGRRKRPSSDPVNAMLSLSYSIFNARCSQALMMVGLDPYIGFYHKISYSRHSLAADMIEPWRPAIDQFVLQLFQDKTIIADYFKYEQSACLLNKKGRSLFYPAFEKKMQLWQKGINRMARFMVQELKREISQQKHNERPVKVGENLNLF